MHTALFWLLLLLRDAFLSIEVGGMITITNTTAATDICWVILTAYHPILTDRMGHVREVSMCVWIVFLLLTPNILSWECHVVV